MTDSNPLDLYETVNSKIAEGEKINARLNEDAESRSRARERVDREETDAEEQAAALRDSDRTARERAADDAELTASDIYDGGKLRLERAGEREELIEEQRQTAGEEATARWREQKAANEQQLAQHAVALRFAVPDYQRRYAELTRLGQEAASIADPTKRQAALNALQPVAEELGRMATKIRESAGALQSVETGKAFAKAQEQLFAVVPELRDIGTRQQFLAWAIARYGADAVKRGVHDEGAIISAHREWQDHRVEIARGARAKDKEAAKIDRRAALAKLPISRQMMHHRAKTRGELNPLVELYGEKF